jgi:hypothetical protein
LKAHCRARLRCSASVRRKSARLPLDTRSIVSRLQRQRHTARTALCTDDTPHLKRSPPNGSWAHSRRQSRRLQAWEKHDGLGAANARCRYSNTSCAQLICSNKCAIVVLDADPDARGAPPGGRCSATSGALLRAINRSLLTARSHVAHGQAQPGRRINLYWTQVL